MAERGAQDKTEKPTPRRRQKAREQGQVAKSAEVASVGVLLFGVGALWLTGGWIYQQITSFMRYQFMGLATPYLSQPRIIDLSAWLWNHFLKTVAPVWIAVCLGAVLANLWQVGFMFTTKRLVPDLNRINPISGFKRFFSLKILVDLFKNLGKLAVVGTVAYLTVWAEWDNLPRLGEWDLEQIILYIIGVCFKIFWRAVLAMVVLAFLDWAYQKWDYERNLKMSKQEVKDEYRQTEGDPQVKSRIRSLQREMARKRMMTSVPEADVVITNPTHLAVALAYRPEEMEAPKVVAKGAGKVAEKIKATAREHNIPVIEDPPLAQALYKQVEVGDTIPADLYESVATILAHVYRMKNKHRRFLSQGGMAGAAP
jgi:flagellar biosynthetic protein FlhB